MWLACFVQREQIGQHELMVSRYERELTELRKNPPDRTVQARQLQDFCKLESYVKFEVTARVVVITTPSDGFRRYKSSTGR